MSPDCVSKSTNIISTIKYVLKSSCLCVQNTYLFPFLSICFCFPYLECQMFFSYLPICQS
uniref:MSTP099 n=1 Tax=Homo sapiens TaxID=9606 RepID=Q7Z4E0_HUMAN|nr:MSTP099 [Homo sapiens]